MPGQTLVKEGEVGIDQVCGRQVFLNQMMKVSPGFDRQVMIQEVIVFGVELEGRSHLVQRSQVQPLIAEGADHAMAAFITKHAVDLGAESSAGEITRISEVEKLGVRDRKPEDSGEIGGLGIGWIGMLAGCQEESGRADDRFQPDLGRLDKITIIREPTQPDSKIGRQFLLAQFR